MKPGKNKGRIKKMSNPNKKISANPSPNVSPGTQKSVGAMISQEMIKELKELRVAMTSGLSKVQQDLADVSAQLKDQIEGLGNKMEEIQKEVSEIKHETRNLTKNVKRIEKRTDKIQKKTDEIEEKQKELEQSTLRWDMERAAFMLRIQNIPEDLQENLRRIVVEILAPLAEQETEEFQKELDLAYRVSSSFARRNNTPREVHVKLTRRHIRDIILRKARDGNIRFKDKEIQIAKEVPWSMRKKRRDYEEIATILREKEIIYRWLTPEGLAFRFEGHQYNINSVLKAEEFLKKNEKKLGRKRRKKPKQAEGARAMSSPSTSGNSSNAESDSEEEKEEEGELEKQSIGVETRKQKLQKKKKQLKD